MRASPSPGQVARRLERLRVLYLPETVEDARRRFAAERPSRPSFSERVAARLTELRALSELSAYLRSR